MKPTAKNVAHAANVSLSAVSRAFQPGTPLDAEKRKLILDAASKLGYVSPARRTAEAIASGTVTLVTGDLANPFYPLVLEQLARRLQSVGQQLLVYALPDDATVDSTINQIVAARPRAVIVTSAHLTSKMATACRQHSIKIVLLNRIQYDVRADSIACDNYSGGRDVAEYLVGKGYRRIGFIGGIASTSTHVERARGFRDRLAEHGLKIFKEADGAFNYSVAFSASKTMLGRKNSPEALFCCNDLMALAAIDAAHERGMTLPNDIAIVGFDDIPMASWNSYRLTTIRQPVSRMIDEALNLIDAGDTVSTRQGAVRILPGQLVVRSSA